MQFVFILTESSSSCSYSVEGMPMDCEVRRWSHNLATFCLGCGPNNGSKVTSRVKSFFLWPKQVVWLYVCQHSNSHLWLGNSSPTSQPRSLANSEDRILSLKKCVCVWSLLAAHWAAKRLHNRVVGCQLVIFVPVNLAILMNLEAEFAITRSPYLPLMEETTSHASPKAPLPRSFCFIWTKCCAQRFWTICSANDKTY